MKSFIIRIALLVAYAAVMYIAGVFVRAMRTAQQQYFTLAAKARKTKLPADWAAAANQLKVSKQLEEQVDKLVA